jgi:hypothetical protein
VDLNLEFILLVNLDSLLQRRNSGKVCPFILRIETMCRTFERNNENQIESSHKFVLIPTFINTSFALIMFKSEIADSEFEGWKGIEPYL